MFKLVGKYIKDHKWLYVLVGLVLIIYDASLVVPTQIIQRLIDLMTTGSLTKSNLWLNIGILVGATVVSYVTAFFWSLKIFQQASRFKFDLQQNAFKKLVSMRTPFYEKFRSGDMMTRFSSDVEMLQDLVGYGLMTVLYAGGMLLFIIPVMFAMSWQITFAALLPVIILSSAIYFISRKTDSLFDDNREAVANLSNEVVEAIEGVRVMRAYSRKDLQATRFRQKTQDLVDRENRLVRVTALYNPIYTLMFGATTLVTLLLGTTFVADGSMTVGQVLAMQLYTVSLTEPISMLSELVLVYQTGRTSFEKLQGLIETSDDMEADGELEAQAFEVAHFKDYSFTYPQATHASLNSVSFSLKKGQTLGIVGKTGSGKTTLVRQFLRQYPVGSGGFGLNGRAITEYARKSVEGLIGYVPQEHILFSRSVGENIAMGKPNADENAIHQAIETAAFTEDLERMSNGLATTIGERGVSISGGQKQRISLARAFIKDPELLILDDSLSAVDARTEKKIIQNIQKERAGKTNIIVTHRLSAVQHADWVLVLEDGRIVEEGTPDDLIQLGGWYFEQYQRQQAQGIEEEV
ncbi:ABC transporter ATP-binding protein [Streptococcus hillyeri]|uniref:ABC transporter ATP-binding protein n=1 Tax=Streptococcus hillyeri TaxID=2282420 RepID=A0A3L9E2B1_9STRE|nr:ABC transporter ATP-binding protein [Streptococcus hillyeri]RLY05280.1 ABC transporter ATP-binding protein [Streptococcus hillyeri]